MIWDEVKVTLKTEARSWLERELIYHDQVSYHLQQIFAVSGRSLVVSSHSSTDNKGSMTSENCSVRFELMSQRAKHFASSGLPVNTSMTSVIPACHEVGILKGFL